MINISGIVKRFGETTVLDGLSRKIENGSVWGLVGINGAGKSTLLRIMTGIYTADCGTVEYDGEAVFENPAVKGKISFVPDDLYLPAHSTMEDMAKIYKLLKRSFNEERFRELAATFELDTKKRFGSFSKGMRRQAATALAIVEGNPYIFFDETFDGLDPFKRGYIKHILREEAKARGTTVIITSHSLRELEDVCDSLAILDGGRFIENERESRESEGAVKIQIAYSEPYDESKFVNLDIIRFNKRGSVALMIVRGEEAAVLETLRATSPLFLEVLPMTLEEVFSYNLDEHKLVEEEGSEK